MSIIKFMIVVISFLLGVYLTLERKRCTAIFILVLTLSLMFACDLYKEKNTINKIERVIYDNYSNAEFINEPDENYSKGYFKVNNDTYEFDYENNVLKISNVNDKTDVKIIPIKQKY